MDDRDENGEGREELPYECDLCDDRFATREELRDHVWEVHEMDGDITT